MRRWLAEWAELDEAACMLGVTIGIFQPDEPIRDLLARIARSDDPLGRELIAFVQRLAELGYLGSRENGYEVRWQQS